MKKIILFFLIPFFADNANCQIVNNLSVTPNPFSTSTNIQFQLFQSDTVSLHIVNVMGSTVATFFQDTFLPVGNYSITLNGDSLQDDGMYLIILNIADSAFLKKVVYSSFGGTSTENIETKSTITIYPNPATAQLTIEIPSGVSPHQIEIIDALGRKIYSEKTNLKSQIINLKSFPSGIYFIKIQMEDGSVTVRKFVKE